MFVPVVDNNQCPLMPTTPARARRWIESGKATGFWKRGIFCVRLNVQSSNRHTQPIAVGIDPGSKREGFSVKSQAHTYLNILAHAVDWVKEHVETRAQMRRTRRGRKTPCRQPRSNRLVNTERLPPSTRSRWQWKLRVVNWLTKVFPITAFVVEDIKAKTWKNAKKKSVRARSRCHPTHNALRRIKLSGLPPALSSTWWNVSFSPLEVGKTWFYNQLRSLGILETKSGMETKELRDSLGLKKTKNKLAEKFEAHNVDSWCLANWYTEGHSKPDNTQLLVVIPLRFHHRQLHRLEHAPGHIRSPYGGTMSLGFKRGSLVKHPKHKLCFIGGSSKGRVSLHSVETGKRLCQNAKPQDIKFLTYNTWRTAFLPA